MKMPSPLLVCVQQCLLGQGDGSVGGDDVNPDYLISIPGNQDMYGRRREPHFFLKLSSDLHVHALVHMYRHTQRPTKINKLKFKKLSIYSGLTYFHNLKITI